MKHLIRIAFAAISPATIAPVANAKSTITRDAQATQIQQTGSYN